MNRIWIIAFAFVLGSCATTHENLNGVLWTQTSPEFMVSSAQAFTLAELQVEKAIADKNWTALPDQTSDYQSLAPAVIVDVDETMLDNSPFQARLVEDGKEFDPELWSQWVNEIQAEAISGAKEFVDFLDQKGVKIFYVTNRVLEAPTVKNIQLKLDADVTSADVYCKYEKEEWGSNKTPRRNLIAENYRVVLLIGDDYNDFTDLGKVSPSERVAKASAFEKYWGTKWIVLSNPHYGNWERSLYIGENKKKGKLKEKYSKLETAR
ncbi:MAG: 5'-nucleotidase (lipoprotein e(P4) family) [Limisphaerales bacterium]|jgi:5'-nucleotidase (lipoprotein e(P4) family)